MPPRCYAGPRLYFVPSMGPGSLSSWGPTVTAAQECVYVCTTYVRVCADALNSGPLR
jgi:hypothetical protein